MSPIRRELERRTLGFDERGILLRQCVLRLGHDAHEIRLSERLELDANRKSSLQLRNEIARLGDVERTGRDEENVVRLHHSVLGLHVGAFDDREEIALNALA